MGGYKLQNNFPSVVDRTSRSYGGNQLLARNRAVIQCGCGIVASCDLFLYMHFNKDGCRCEMFSDIESSDMIPLDLYNGYIDKLRRFFPLIPPFGINGPLLALGINAFFNANNIPYKAKWGISNCEMWGRIESMLQKDMPVIISVGPNLPFFWQKHKTDMYSISSSGAMRKAVSVNAHYMNITALDDEWLTVSSWGRKYFIRRIEYTNYVKKYSNKFVSNIVYIKAK